MVLTGLVVGSSAPATRCAAAMTAAAPRTVAVSAVAEHRRHPPDGITCTFPAASGGQGHPDTKGYGRGSGSRSRNLDTVRVEAGTVAEHRAGDRPPNAGRARVRDRRRVATVLVVPDRIALGGDASPMVGGVAQPVVPDGPGAAARQHRREGPPGAAWAPRVSEHRALIETERGSVQTAF